MKTIITLIILAASVAIAQTCILPAPSAPPRPRECVVVMPTDAGKTGCTIRATVPGGAQPTDQSIPNGKCAVAVDMCGQAAAIDNGWNDGGTP